MENFELRRPAVRAPGPPVLLHVFHSFGCGGAQTRFVHLANHFQSRLRHIVIAMNGDYSSMNALAPNSCVTRFGSEISKGSFVGRLPQKRAALAAIDPDILVTHNWGTIDWALARLGYRARHIHMEDGFGPDETDTRKRRRNLARRALLSRSRVIVPSTTLKKIARERWKIPSANLQYIPNGIDCARFAKRRSGCQAAPWQGGSAPVVGIVAGLRAEKNLARLIRATALLRDKSPIRLVIVGDGTQRTSLQSLAADLGIGENVTFTGHIADPAHLYGSFDLFALTSDTEQMPYTVLEAMAAGLVVVATDVGDIKSMVSAENAPLIVGRNDQAVADAILRAVKEPAFVRRVGAANQARARRHYDQSAMFAAYAELYGLPAERGPSECEARA